MKVPTDETLEALIPLTTPRRREPVRSTAATASQEHAQPKAAGADAPVARRSAQADAAGDDHDEAVHVANALHPV